MQELEVRWNPDINEWEAYSLVLQKWTTVSNLPDEYKEHIKLLDTDRSNP